MPVKKQTTTPRFQVDRIYFKLSLLKAIIPIKFKCRFFVQLKTYSTTSTLKSLARSKDHYRAINSKIQFDKDEVLQFDSYLVFDNDINRYKKKQIQIIVNLISDNRTDQVKLVGRIRLDLNQFMIDNQGQILTKEQILENCSVSKPEVAKLQYQLQLVREQKIKIQSSPDKQSVFAEIERSLFADALEYNDFSKQVFGKESPPSYSQSKLNRSLNQSKISKSMSSSSVEKPTTKLTPVPLPKEDLLIPLKQNSDRSQSKSKLERKQGLVKEKKSELIKEKKPLIPGVSSQKKPITKKQQTPAQTAAQRMEPQTPIQSFKTQKYEQQTPTLSVTRLPLSHNPHVQSPSIQHPEIPFHRQIQIQSPSNQPIQTQSSSHQPPQSPRKMALRQNRQSPTKQKHGLQSPTNRKQDPESPTKRKQGASSKLIAKEASPLSPDQQQVQIRNPLTQSMFQQQQVLIQNLQQQLQQANQIIQQYRLQLDLIKQETQRLQTQKGVHVAQMQLSRTRGQQTERATKENKGLIQELQASTEEIERLKTQIQEYSKVFVQKQEIISEKDKVIEGLESTIQLVTIEYEGKLAQQDQLYNGMHQKYLQASQQESYLKTVNEELKVKLFQKDEEINKMERIINELNQQILSLNTNTKSSSPSNVSDQLVEKDRRIKELQSLLSTQKNTHTQQNLRVSQMLTAIQTNNKQIQSMRAVCSKQEETSKKLTEQKQKTQQQMQKSIQKSKQLQKEKYLLTQQITTLNLQGRSVDKLVQQKVTSYKTQLHQLTLSYQQSQNKISQLKFAVQSYQSALKQQQKKHREQVEQLTKKLQTFNTKEHLLRQSLDLLEKQTTQIRIYVQEKENKLREFQELVIFKDEEIQEKNDKLAYLERKQRMADNTIEELKMQLKMTEAMYSDSYENHQNGNKDKGENSSRLTILNEANMQLLQKQKMQSQRLNQKDRLIHQLQKTLTTIDPLKRQIHSLQSKISELQTKNNQLKEQIKNLTKTITEQHSKQQQQTSQLQHVYSQCETFQQQIKSLEEEKVVLCNQQQQKELQMLHLQSEEEYLRETVGKLEKKIDQKETKLLETVRLLKRSEDIEDQLNQRIRQLSTETLNNNKKETDLTQNKTHENTPNIKETRSKQEQEIYRLTEQLQTYKQREESYMCNVLDLQQQLQKVKKQKLSLSSLQEQKNTLKMSQNIQGMNNFDKKDLKVACDQLQRLIEQRIKNRETESLIQVILSNSQGFAGSESRASNQEGNLLSRQKNTLQQKSRILSRQVQKIKSVIFKKSQLSYKDKTEMIQLLKPCENITNELIKAVEDFAKDNDQQVYSEA